METPKMRKTQVIIVGGGLTGLTLALMLERLNVPYLLLEAYSSLTAPVGAALGLFANGARVMDQLDVLEELEQAGQSPTRHQIVDVETGNTIMDWNASEVSTLAMERHGYTNLLLSRQEILVILERRLKNKDCLLANKRVTRVEQSESAATVNCKDGSQYEAQIVVGANGVRSTVRAEMRRLAQERSPGWFPEKKTMRCEYAIVFAVAPPHPEVQAGDIISLQRSGFNAGIMCGRGGVNFLFCYWRLPPSRETIPADDIPRISEEEAESVWQRARAFPLNCGEGVTFGDVMDRGMERKGSSVLPHHAFEKWHYGRTMMIGDAAHKFNPTGGQGGNSCIESAAALVNQLQQSLEERELSLQDSEWPREAVEEAFAAVHKQRFPRVSDLILRSQRAQYMTGWENWFYKLMSKYIVPRFPTSMHADVLTSTVVDGTRLKGKEWERPARAHSVPWADKKPLQSMLGGLASALMILSAVAAGVLIRGRIA